ncbi:MAG: ABC transporter permease [Myxococcota bacterium]
MGENAAEPVISVRGLEKHYAVGEAQARALRGVSLDINRGELVAIMGASGSGKSTLLNLLGCLDRPTAGSYRLAGHDVADLDAEERSRIRRQFLGFIFQGFHLLPGTSALESVEMPLVYQGVPAETRRRLAQEALILVGLGERLHHTPAQLSGGQQQRVAIARALVTSPQVLLADEPTGNLDSQTTEEILGILQRLHQDHGLTIILVTHDPEVARTATRVITVKDGLIAQETRVENRRHIATENGVVGAEKLATRFRTLGVVGQVMMGLRLAVRALRGSKLRTGLTTLGILIGIAAVVTTTALGAGARERMEREMLALGANMLVVTPESSSNAAVRNAPGMGVGLTARDAEAVGREVPSVAAAAATLSSSVQVVASGQNTSTRVTGTTPSYLTVRNWTVADGAAFDDGDMKQSARVCLIGSTVRRNLFPSDAPVLGTTIRVGRTPCEVIGELASRGQTGFGQDQDDVVLMPLSTYRAHVARRSGDDVDNILVSARSPELVARAEAAVRTLLRQRHRIPSDGEEDFNVRNLSEMLKALDAQRAAITLLLLAIASISLLVGGIGVMNIMLVSVTERTREIGIRLAIGARPVDILTQFLLEAVVLAAVGGVAGLAVGASASALLEILTSYSVRVQPTSALLALSISCGIGIAFGFFPARHASALDPIASLRHE